MTKTGAITRLVTLTRGEVSTLRHGLKSTDKLEDIREKELKSAAKTLGLSDIKIGNFGDGKIKSSKKRVADYLKREIMKYNPEVVITYEPSGVYGHPDHIATTEIVRTLKSKYKYKLLYTTVAPKTKISENLLKMADEPEKIIPLMPQYKLKLTAVEVVKKLLALQNHRSQFGINIWTVPFVILKFRKFLFDEYFVFDKKA
jgi:LmbE family N-acetylglucosaminyl deacetylase